MSLMLTLLYLACVPQTTLAADEPSKAAALIERFNREKSPVWADGEEATFFFRGEAERVDVIAGGEFKALDRIPASDVWCVTSKFAGLDRAVISYVIAPKQKSGPARATVEGVWRGPKAPPEAARAAELRGSLKTIEIESSALGARRKLTVYLPPDFAPGRASRVIYAADGESTSRYAPFLEPLITSGKIPAVVLVGVHSGGYVGGAPDYQAYDTKKDMRAQEYFPGINAPLFAKHETFFCSEVTAFAEREWKVSSQAKDRALFGCSNGGRFVFEMGIRHPDRFGHILAFSVPGGGEINLPAGQKTAAHFYLEAGTWERQFETYTKRLAEAVERAGFGVTFRSRVGGHDEAIWSEEFAQAVVTAFAPG